jgi:hypothetical protein
MPRRCKRVEARPTEAERSVIALVRLAAREGAPEHAEPTHVIHRIARVTVLVHQERHLIDGLDPIRERDVEQREHEGLTAAGALLEDGMVADGDAPQRAGLGPEPSLLRQELNKWLDVDVHCESSFVS